MNMSLSANLRSVFPTRARVFLKDRHPEFIAKAAFAIDSLPSILDHRRLRLRWLNALPHHFVSRKMWSGFGPHAAAELEKWKFAVRGKPLARPANAWLLAQWYGDNGDYKSALDNLVLLLSTAPRLRRIVNVQLMMVECLLQLDRPDHAKQWLAWASKGVKDPRTEFYLSAANICYAFARRSASDVDADSERLSWINRAYENAGFSEISKRDGNAPLTLDNIVVRSPRPVDASSKLSVLMPAYNCADTLPIALTSILNQTWDNFELIVVDDKSSDDTWSVIERFAKHDSRIVPIRHERNGGAYAARNTALAHATGEFVTVHDADDWSHPEKFAAQMQHALLRPDSINTTVGVRVSRDLRFGVKARTGGMMMENLSSFLVKRTILTELGGWDRIRMGADSELYERVKAKYRLETNKLFPRVPLTFILFSGMSLTQTTAAGLNTLLYGARRQYKESYRFWHAAELAKTEPDFRLSSSRRFPVPRVMLKRSEPITDIDVIFIGDFAESDRSFQPEITQWKDLADKGVKLGIVHWPTYSHAERNIALPVRSAIAEGIVENIVPGETVICKTAVAPSAQIFDLPPHTVPSIQPERVFVVDVAELSERQKEAFARFFGSAPIPVGRTYLETLLS